MDLFRLQSTRRRLLLCNVYGFIIGLFGTSCWLFYAWPVRSLSNPNDIWVDLPKDPSNNLAAVYAPLSSKLGPTEITLLGVIESLQARLDYM